METEQRKLHKSGAYSRALIIPREFLKALNLRDNQILKISLDLKKKRLIIEK